MRIALLGLPGSGKTTVFNAVAEDAVHVPPGTLQTETHIQVVKVNDARLDHCRRIYQPKKFTPAGLELWDPPGVPVGGGERERERRVRLLAALREADAYVLVVRGFQTDRYPYERPAADPQADCLRLTEDLVTADFVVAEGRMTRLTENLRRNARTADEDRKELAVLEKCAARFEAGRDLSDLELDPHDEKRIRGFQFFSGKPLILLFNGPGDVPAGLGDGAPLPFRARLAMDAQLEAELAAMDPADRPAFMEEFGIEESATDRFVHEVYRGVGLLSFFTVGDDEVRAWTLRQGGTAVEAAGKIHTDLARGFVRAEVFGYEDLAAAGTERALKASGGIRLESKDYEVKDGEIVHIRSAL
ncbi:MAG: DUF933 domain-containing protein [Planctomycetota bacterium]|jgi:ribosome-binding ATPase YchF (GTP1/OBG family)